MPDLHSGRCTRSFYHHHGKLFIVWDKEQYYGTSCVRAGMELPSVGLRGRKHEIKAARSSSRVRNCGRYTTRLDVAAEAHAAFNPNITGLIPKFASCQSTCHGWMRRRGRSGMAHGRFFRPNAIQTLAGSNAMTIVTNDSHPSVVSTNGEAAG